MSLSFCGTNELQEHEKDLDDVDVKGEGAEDVLFRADRVLPVAYQQLRVVRQELWKIQELTSRESPKCFQGRLQLNRRKLRSTLVERVICTRKQSISLHTMECLYSGSCMERLEGKLLRNHTFGNHYPSPIK